MPTNDVIPRALSDIANGFGLLTRIPLPISAPARAEAAWAWPLVGVAIAAAAAATAGAVVAMGGPPGVAAVAALATSAILTGAMHEDGLADCADGFYGGHNRQRRLEIMKDSHIGSYGTLALVLVTLARWSALTTVIASGDWGAMLAIGALSRAAMAVLMAFLPNARGAGLSQAIGQPGRKIAALACASALVPALIFYGAAATALTLAVCLATLGAGALARAKIGGQTGDVLGAVQQLAETAALATAALS